MGTARKLQPRTAAGGQAQPSLTDLTDLIDRGIDDAWDRADGMVALPSWAALSDALSSGCSDLEQAWLTLTSVGNGACLRLVRAAIMEVAPGPTDERLLLTAGFRPRSGTGMWLRPVEGDDLAAAVRTLKGPLEVAHPRVLRFTLHARHASSVRLLFGPLREQQRRPPAAAVRSDPSAQDRSGPPCRRCGQPMIDPLSIARGYGPDCWDVLGRESPER